MRKRANLLFIGITQRLIENESYKEFREALALDWGSLFNDILFKPFLPLPLSYELDFKDYKPHLNAVILSGGNDLSLFNTNFLSQKRDTYERQIISSCLENDIPLLGICRGAQMIAHYFNATILKKPNHTKKHLIQTNKGEFMVNSFHNYSITNLKDPLEILALAQDKSIEAFKHKNAKIFGIMWHIERNGGLNADFILKEWLESIRRK